MRIGSQSPFYANVMNSDKPGIGRHPPSRSFRGNALFRPSRWARFGQPSHSPGWLDWGWLSQSLLPAIGVSIVGRFDTPDTDSMPFGWSAILCAVLFAAGCATNLVVPASAQDMGKDAARVTTSVMKVSRNGSEFDITIYSSAAQRQLGTVVLLHGFPGTLVPGDASSRTHLLASSLSMSGYTVVRFNYTGSWANDGQFSWWGGVLDAEAVLRFMRSETMRLRGIDVSRVALVGHSYGGWVALMTAARDPEIRCVAVTASANQGTTAKRMRNNSDAYNRIVASYENVLRRSEPPIRAKSAGALADELIEHADAWDLVNSVDHLKFKELLFVSAERERSVTKVHAEPVVDALRRANATSIEAVEIEGADHNFTQRGPQVNETVRRWLAEKCVH